MKEQKQEKKGLSGALKKFYGVGAVSYTHLDVYKRQSFLYAEASW